MRYGWGSEQWGIPMAGGEQLRYGSVSEQWSIAGEGGREARLGREQAGGVWELMGMSYPLSIPPVCYIYNFQK